MRIRPAWLCARVPSQVQGAYPWAGGTVDQWYWNGGQNRKFWLTNSGNEPPGSQRLTARRDGQALAFATAGEFWRGLGDSYGAGAPPRYSDDCSPA
jgi:hypothetical protein